MVVNLRTAAVSEIAELAYLIYSARKIEPNDPGYCLFIGSGCSLPFAPSSTKLVDDLLKEMYPKEKPTERRRIFQEKSQNEGTALDSHSLEVVAKAYKRKKGDEALRRFLVANFSTIPKNNKGYADLCSLVEDGYFKLIFTTNLDTLIEDTFLRQGLDFDLFNDLSDYSKRPSVYKPIVYKLHGSYNKIDPDVTWDQTQALHPRKQLHLRHFFESNTFIFVGYSGLDTDIIAGLYGVDPIVRDRLRIYSFTRSGTSENIKRLLTRYNSEKGNIAMGNIDDGGTFFSVLLDETKSVEEKAKND
jgi:hypothetical protein